MQRNDPTTLYESNFFQFQNGQDQRHKASEKLLQSTQTQYNHISQMFQWKNFLLLSPKHQLEKQNKLNKVKRHFYLNLSSNYLD